MRTLKIRLTLRCFDSAYGYAQQDTECCHPERNEVKSKDLNFAHAKSKISFDFAYGYAQHDIERCHPERNEVKSKDLNFAHAKSKIKTEI